MTRTSIMKRFTIIIAALILSLSMFGCSTNEDTPSTDQIETIMANGSEMSSLGAFETVDINGNVVTDDIFKNNDITLVNILSATCDPCVEELPYLAELAGEYRDKKVGILGVSIDMNTEGKPDESTMEDFKKLLGNGSEMNVIYLDENLMTKVFSETDAIPYTFFVDSNGDVIGERYIGSHSKEEWKEIIEKELSNASA